MSIKLNENSIGRRKSAIAKVKLINGSGKILINNKEGTKYMQYNPKMIYTIQSPLLILGLEENFDTIITASGGGLSGQSEAIRLGLARELCKIDIENRSILKSKGFLKRNAQCKERRKYGLKKARKAPQFSKR